MIRWKYVIPRLVVAGLLVAAMGLGLDPLVRWSLIYVGRSVTGARVAIGRVRTSWTGTKVEVSSILVADPRESAGDIFRAESISLDVDGHWLSRRKLVVRGAEAHGLYVSPPSDSSEKRGQPGDGSWREGLQQRGREWLDSALGLLAQDLQEELESVRLAQELSQRWPQEYDRLQSRAQRLKQRVVQLRQVAQTTRDPLQAVQVYPRVAAELTQLREELTQLRGEAGRLEQQALRDKEAIAQAKQRDLETIRKTLRLENLSEEKLSEYLLGPDLGPPLASLLDWVRWSRQHVPSKPAQLTARRARGLDIPLPVRRQAPDLLIRRLAVDGLAVIDSRPVALEGLLTGLTSHPDLYGQPTTLQLKLNGKEAISVQAVLDRRKRESHDRVVIDCPVLAQPARVLGDADRLAVSVSPGQAHAWVRLTLDGDALGGEIVWQQQPADLVPRLGGDWQTTTLDGVLQQSLAQVKTLEIAVDLEGSVDKPRCKVRSNLGAQLADGLSRAVMDQVAVRREELVQRAETRIAAQVASLEKEMLAQRDYILEQVRLGDAEIEQLIRQVTGPQGVADKLMGRDSPLRGILRR